MNAIERKWLSVVTVILALLGIGYWLLGLYNLALSSSWQPNDLKMRWEELQYVAQGVDPLRVIRGEVPPDPLIGKVRDDGGYTSWSYTMAELFVTRLPFPLVRFYFALTCLCSLAVIGRWSYRRGLPHGTTAARLFAVAALAPSGFYVALTFGNYAILVTAMIMLMADFEQRRMSWPAGLILGLAMIKPHMAGLFVFVLLVRGNWRGILAAGLTVLAAMSLTAWRLSTGPIEMLTSMFSQSLTFRQATFGILHFLIDAGVEIDVVLKIGLVLGVGAACWLTWWCRHCSVYTLICIPTVITQLCTYHWRYDYILVAILLIALGEAAYRTDRRLVWAAFWSVGLTLWFPLPLKYFVGPVPYLYFGIWILGLIVVIRTDPATKAPPIDKPLAAA